MNIGPFSFTWGKKETAESPIVPVTDLDPFTFSAYSGQNQYSGAELSTFDGSKFFGGFGTTQVQQIDYWTLRARSAQVFTENMYARGIIRRLVTNEINTGLDPEAIPDDVILAEDEETLNEWSELVETRFAIWGKDPELCSWKHNMTFAAIQRAARMEALVSGDVLVVMRQSQRTKLPMIQLVSGNKVQTPLMGEINIRVGHKITHGVETDKHDRVVAFWIKQDDLSSKRIPANGEKSGRKIAWLVYGTDKRLDDIRGQPLLSLVLQSLKEIDRYRDSAQRKAVINSILAMFIKKTEDKPGTLPITGGAVKKVKGSVTDSDGSTRDFNIAKQMPGMVLEELQQGEEPVGFNNNGTDVAFGVFEQSIIQAIAWSNQIPPTILTLAFTKNYAASQAEINEFKIYLNMVWADWGETFCTPIYKEWLISEVLLKRIPASNLLESWRNPLKYDIFGAWTAVDWYGSIKPSTDMLKQTKGSEKLIEMGLSTRGRESRGLTGTKFEKNIKRLKKENELLVDAHRPLAEFKKEFGEDLSSGDSSTLEAAAAEIVTAAEELGEIGD